MVKEDILSILRNKKTQWVLAIVALLIIVFLSSNIRMSNWDLLTDQTTGEKLPIELDTMYFLRIAETILEHGELPKYDKMRYPSVNVEFSNEILPRAVIFLYKVGNIFGDYTLREANVFSPVFFYFLGIIVFFFLIYTLTGSKLNAIFGSAFLAFVPAYLFRTVAGFSDHESIGAFAFFSVMIVCALSLKYINDKKDLKKTALFALGTAFFSTFTIVSWGGIAEFVFMIIPLAFFIIWAVKMHEEDKEKDFIVRGILFFSIWIVFSVLFGLVFGYSLELIMRRFLFSTNGLIGPLVLGFIIVDSLIISYEDKISFIKKKYRVFYTAGVLAVLGVIGLQLMGNSIFTVLNEVWVRVFHPWGLGRVGLTVAENAQPHLVDWISQVGSVLFWLFFGGMVLVGFEIAKGVKDRKMKILTVFFWLILISSILFSRISDSSIMNGENVLSQAVYLGGVLIFMAFTVKLYLTEKIKISPELALIISWLIFTLVSGRAAQRIFFAVTPFVCFMGGFFIVKLWDFFKENKDEIMKPILLTLFVVALAGGSYSIYVQEQIITDQAARMAPTAHYQWQNAMSWVRENTDEGDIFIHWWDYGYWVEYLGERPAVVDGGHAIGYWDHLIGRYLLTTSRPETAYSLMKTHNVSYLLIDPTDLGKYPAYSKIGSDKTGEDRYDAIPLMYLDQKNTQEVANGTLLFYSGGMYVYEDIDSHTVSGEKVFLPANSGAGVVGIVLKTTDVQGNMTSFEQPVGVYTYKNKRYDIPLRYLYFNGQLIDFKNGLEAVARVTPAVDGGNINGRGAVIYISPRVTRTLYAQVYLLNDAFKRYPGIKLVHEEHDIVVSSIRQQGIPVESFVIYNGFRGPIKIYEIEYPEGILTREEFLKDWSDGVDWAQFDDLQFNQSQSNL